MQVMVWRTNFDRALEGYVLSAAQPAGAPTPWPAQPVAQSAPETQPGMHASSRSQQHQAPSQPQPVQGPAAESQQGHADGSKPKPAAWVLAGTKPTQPPSMSGPGKASKNIQPLGQNQATAVQRPSTACASVPLPAALPGGLELESVSFWSSPCMHLQNHLVDCA